MTDIAPGSVTIADLYRELLAMRTDVTQALSRLERVDERNHAAERVQDDHETRLRVLESAPDVPADLEGRVRALEKMAWKLTGAFAVVNALAVLVEWLIWSHR